MEKIRFFKGNFNELPKERLADAFYYVVDRKQIIINDMIVSEGGSGGEGGDPAKYNELLEMINKNSADIVDLSSIKLDSDKLKTVNGESLVITGDTDPTDLKVSGGIDIVHSDEELSTLVKEDGNIATMIKDEGMEINKIHLDIIPYFNLFDAEFKSEQEAINAFKENGIEVSFGDFNKNISSIDAQDIPSDMEEKMFLLALINSSDNSAYMFINSIAYSPTNSDFIKLFGSTFVTSIGPGGDNKILFNILEDGTIEYNDSNIQQVNDLLRGKKFYILLDDESNSKEIILKIQNDFDNFYNIKQEQFFLKNITLKTKLENKWEDVIRIDKNNNIFVKDSNNNFSLIPNELKLKTINNNSLKGDGNLIFGETGKRTLEGGEIYNSYDNTDNTYHPMLNEAYQFAHAEGGSTLAIGMCSHAEGCTTKAQGYASHAEGGSSNTNKTLMDGIGTISYGNFSHAEGNGTRTFGLGSHSEGIYSKAGETTYTVSNVIVYNTSLKKQYYVKYSDYYSEWYSETGETSSGYMYFDVYNNEGQKFQCTKENLPRNERYSYEKYYFVERESGIRYDYNSSCISYETNGDASHAEGYDTKTNGYSSHAEGYRTIANGDDSHSEGEYTVTNNEAEHAEGKFNTSHTGETSDKQTLSSIGIGTRTDVRKNAFEVMNNGDMYIHGVNGFDGVNVTGNTLQALIASMQQEIKDLKLEIQNLKKP